MEKQKLRSEIDDKYKWDLTKIYKTSEDFYSDLDTLNIKIGDYSKYTNDLFKSIDNLKSFFKLENEVDKLINKIYSYGQRKFDEDTTCVSSQKMYQEVQDIYNKYLEATSFFLPLLYDTDKSIIDKYLLDSELVKYKRYFDELYRIKNYTLSKNEEQILATLSSTLSASSDTYESLTDTDITFPVIKDEEEKDVELTESNYSKFIRSRNRKVRKDAFLNLFSTYEKYKNTITSIYLGHINSDIAITKIRNYKSTIERYLYQDNINLDIYNNLIDTVSKRQDVIDNYFKTIKDALELDELHRYDTYTSLVDKCNKSYSFEEAKEIVLSSLKVLGNDYITTLNKAFDENWIDVYNNKGKRGGAYSSGTYDTVPYILLNYEGKLDDVSTLAHELGHSMHTYYSCKSNDRLYSDYKIFVAEVASTTNELLLNNYLLKTSVDEKEKLSILNSLISLYYSTIVRQTMFAEFERDVYALRENEEAVTHEVLENKYYDLCKKYFGKNVYLDEEVKYEWERIPHFYYGFYVYKYATSLAASTYISEKILNNDDNYIDKYIKFLSSGSSMDPLDELKMIDVDLSDKKVIDQAMDKFNYYIGEFKKVYQKVKGSDKNGR